jgi:hypothetical protein
MICLDAGSGDDAGTGDAGQSCDGGGGDTGPVSVERLIEAIHDRYRDGCECWYMEGGWSSIEACTSYASWGEGYASCLRMVYPMHEEALREYFACEIEGYETAAACIEAAMCADEPECGFDCAKSSPGERERRAFLDAMESCYQTMLVGPPGSCPDPTSVSTTTGMAVFSGTTIGRGDDLYGDCGGDGPDVAHRWRATTAGLHVIDTYGSEFDTVLYVHEGGCGGPVLACSNDARGVLSEVTVELDSGQEVIISVDGDNELGGGANYGRYFVNIRAP